MSAQGPPEDKWERETADGAGAAKTWGLRDSMLTQLASEPTAAMRAIHTRLTRLYPEYDIAHMPAELMQAASPAPDHPHNTSALADPEIQRSMCSGQDAAAGCGGAQERASLNAAGAPAESGEPTERTGSSRAVDGRELRSASEQHGEANGAEVPSGGLGGMVGGGEHECGSGGQERGQAAFCAQFVGNAPVAGDQYTWHVDADPASFPESRCGKSFQIACVSSYVV